MMYKIIKDGVETTVTKITFIKKQEHGVVVTCDDYEAQGMVSFDYTENWAFIGKGLEGQLDADVECIPISTEEYLINMHESVAENQLIMMEAIADLYESR